MPRHPGNVGRGRAELEMTMGPGDSIVHVKSARGGLSGAVAPGGEQLTGVMGQQLPGGACHVV
jgi:hypothetical protein